MRGCGGISLEPLCSSKPWSYQHNQTNTRPCTWCLEDTWPEEAQVKSSSVKPRVRQTISTVFFSFEDLWCQNRKDFPLLAHFLAFWTLARSCLCWSSEQMWYCPGVNGSCIMAPRLCVAEGRGGTMGGALICDRPVFWWIIVVIGCVWVQLGRAKGNGGQETYRRANEK